MRANFSVFIYARASLSRNLTRTESSVLQPLHFLKKQRFSEPQMYARYKLKIIIPLQFLNIKLNYNQFCKNCKKKI